MNNFNKIYKNLEANNKSTFPKIRSEKVFFNNVADSSYLRKFTKNASSVEMETLPIKRVDVNYIIPTQKNLNANNLESTKDVGENTEAHLLKHGKYYYILDGHHRIANEILLGSDTIKAYVYSEPENIQEIRNLIRETLLGEDFESVKIIKTLANETLVLLAKKNINRVNDWAKKDNFELSYLFPVNLAEVLSQSSKDFGVLYEFLKLSENTEIYLTPKWLGKAQKTVRGNYSHVKEKKYNPDHFREINIYYDKEFADKLRREVRKHTEGYGEFGSQDLYFIIYYPFISPLMHEIQHNYDDFRSNSKLFNTKKVLDFVKLDKMIANKEVADKEMIIKRNQMYLNLPHEIWARFTQSMDKVNFIKGDYITNPEGKSYMKWSMNPIHDVAKEFKFEFNGFDILSDDMKKRLYRKVAQFWHLEKEKIEKENANPDLD